MCDTQKVARKTACGKKDCIWYQSKHCCCKEGPKASDDGKCISYAIRQTQVMAAEIRARLKKGDTIDIDDRKFIRNFEIKHTVKHYQILEIKDAWTSAIDLDHPRRGRTCIYNHQIIRALMLPLPENADTGLFVPPSIASATIDRFEKITLAELEEADAELWPILGLE